MSSPALKGFLPPPFAHGCAATGRSVDASPSASASFISAQHFVDTWIARPVRQPATRDFTFKAVVGEPEW